MDIHEIEERKNLHINDLMKNHEKAFGQMKAYYNDITNDNLKARFFFFFSFFSTDNTRQAAKIGMRRRKVVENDQNMTTQEENLIPWALVIPLHRD